MRSDTSGPAFPVGHFNRYNPKGLTKREYFAAMALAGMGTWCPCDEDGRASVDVHSAKAAWAVAQADALIAALKEG